MEFQMVNHGLCCGRVRKTLICYISVTSASSVLQSLCFYPPFPFSGPHLNGRWGWIRSGPLPPLLSIFPPNIQIEFHMLFPTHWVRLYGLYQTATYPRASLRPINGVMCSVKTIRQHISRHPLTGITSSLSRNTCHLHRYSHVNLQELMMVVHPRWPCAHSPSRSLLVQSGQACAMVCIPLGWGADLVAAYAAVFHSHWAIALRTYKLQLVKKSKYCSWPWVLKGWIIFIHQMNRYLIDISSEYPTLEQSDIKNRNIG